MQQLLTTMIERCYEFGLTSKIYYGLHGVAFVAVLLMALWMGKKINVGWLKSTLIVLIVYPLMYAWMLIYFWIESGFQSFGGQHFVCVFIYAPLVALAAAKILKLRWVDICYIIAPCFPLNHMIGHIGCIFAGCCRGYEWEYGMYNLHTGTYLFPIQPIESLIALGIVVFLVVRAYKNKFQPDAKHYPIMLILFGSTRFVCEFFRDNTKILLNCSSLSFHALFMCIVGIVALVVIRKRNRANLSESD